MVFAEGGIAMSWFVKKGLIDGCRLGKRPWVSGRRGMAVSAEVKSGRDGCVVGKRGLCQKVVLSAR